MDPVGRLAHGLGGSMVLDEVLQRAWDGDSSVFRELLGYLDLPVPEIRAVCGISERQWQRWKAGYPVNRSALRLLAILAGYVPWEGWSGWVVCDGHLFPPGVGKHGVSPGEIHAWPFLRQLLAEYQRQVRDFEALPDQAETVNASCEINSCTAPHDDGG